MKKEYIVFSMKLAGELMCNGFPVKRMEKSNRNDSFKNVFIFNESEDLLKYVEHYKQKNHKN